MTATSDARAATSPNVLIADLHFPEGPRFRDGRLLFSDFYAHEVVAVDPDGKRQTVVRVPNQPSGLGFDPQGRLLVVSMLDRRLLRHDPDGLTEIADLSELAPSHLNDMVVDRRGRAYIGNFGFDRHRGEAPRTTAIFRVDPDGAVSVAADETFFPNGSAITDDGETLIVAETWARRLTAFRICADGSLADRRTFADLGDGVPDGICLDAEGAVWVADPRHNEAFRVLEGAQVTQRIAADRGVFACMLGGEDRRTLFLCTAATSGPQAAESRTGRIEYVRVEIPGAGLP